MAFVVVCGNVAKAKRDGQENTTRGSQIRVRN